jgi:hypothetical protein
VDADVARLVTRRHPLSGKHVATPVSASTNFNVLGLVKEDFNTLGSVSQEGFDALGSVSQEGLNALGSASQGGFNTLEAFGQEGFSGLPRLAFSPVPEDLPRSSSKRRLR